MIRKAHRLGISRWAWSIAAIIFVFSLIIVVPSLGATKSVSAACDEKNLKITWSGLNTPVSINVNGSEVFTNGGPSGSFVVNGPGDWTVQVFEFGDPFGS